MFAYILRRLLYAVPILIGVNLLTFALFFVVNTPDDMARLQLGAKHVTAEAIERWKVEHGYDKPLLLNAKATGSAIARLGPMRERISLPMLRPSSPLPNSNATIAAEH